MENQNELGPCEAQGVVVSQANEQRGGFFPGRATTWGYILDTAPAEISVGLRENILLARRLESQAAELDLFLSSESDEAWEAFVVPIEDAADDIVDAVKTGLGLDSDELLVDATMQPATKFLFFDDEELEGARDFLAEEEGVEQPTDDQVLDAIGKDEDVSCFSEEEAQGYHQLTQTMASHLNNLCHLRFDWDAEPSKYTVSPTIVFGVRRGYAVGLWANRYQS